VHIDFLHFENNFILLEDLLLQSFDLSFTEVDLFGEIVAGEGGTCFFDSMIKSLCDYLNTVLDLLLTESPFYDFRRREVLLEKRERERWL